MNEKQELTNDEIVKLLKWYYGTNKFDYWIAEARDNYKMMKLLKELKDKKEKGE